ncbi:MAG: vsr [Verrucomicrobiales bacterium]|nr:vsr [Verrucomicrobiales bacterium]
MASVKSSSYPLPDDKPPVLNDVSSVPELLRPPVSLDPLTPRERSWNMSRIRSTDTKPEMMVRRMLTAMGLRYRLHRRDLPGKPDLVFGPRRTVLFVHGCFWHQHPGCRAARIPTGNREFWEKKLNRNTERDAQTCQTLRSLGWRILTVWECETRDPEKLQRRLAMLFPPLNSSTPADPAAQKKEPAE